jgi:hypothetical protein
MADEALTNEWPETYVPPTVEDLGTVWDRTGSLAGPTVDLTMTGSILQ